VSITRICIQSLARSHRLLHAFRVKDYAHLIGQVRCAHFFPSSLDRAPVFRRSSALGDRRSRLLAALIRFRRTFSSQIPGHSSLLLCSVARCVWKAISFAWKDASRRQRPGAQLGQSSLVGSTSHSRCRCPSHCFGNMYLVSLYDRINRLPSGLWPSSLLSDVSIPGCRRCIHYHHPASKMLVFPDIKEWPT
jgi:hypothetical protein